MATKASPFAELKAEIEASKTFGATQALKLIAILEGKK